MDFVVIWLIFAVVVGAIANSLGRSGLLWFLLSIFISPVLALLFVLIAGRVDKPASRATTDDDQRVRCDHCYELIMPQAILCRHCGMERAPQAAIKPQNPDELTFQDKSEEVGYMVARFIKNPVVWAIVVVAIIAIYLADYF